MILIQTSTCLTTDKNKPKVLHLIINNLPSIKSRINKILGTIIYLPIIIWEKINKKMTHTREEDKNHKGVRNLILKTKINNIQTILIINKIIKTYNQIIWLCKTPLTNSKITMHIKISIKKIKWNNMCKIIRIKEELTKIRKIININKKKTLIMIWTKESKEILIFTKSKIWKIFSSNF